MALPIAMGIMADSVPADRKSLAMSVRLMGNRSAELLNPLFFGLIAGRFGFGATFLAAGILLSVAAPLLGWYGLRFFPRPPDR